MQDSGSTDVVVLCAGRGTRLRPLTDNLPKALVRIGERPLLDYHLKALREAGIQRTICVVGHLAERITEFVGDGSRFGLQIEIVHQDPPNGTGGAVLATAARIHSDPFAVLYADIFFQPMAPVWRELLRDRRPKMLCAEVEDTSRFGRVECGEDEDGKYLKQVIEKDGRKRTGLVNAGLLLLPKSVLGALAGLKPSPRGELELPPVVEALVRSGQKVRIQQVGRWSDIGTLSALESANKFIEANVLS